MIFAIDFDGTIVKNDWPSIGELIEGAVTAIRKIKESGHTVIIWTCREGDALKEAKKFLQLNNIPFDYINENSKDWLRENIDSRKIKADYYIDDLNIGKWTWEDVKNLLN